MSFINFNKQREEIQAWLDKIDLNSLPKNHSEMERLKHYEELHKQDNQKKNKKLIAQVPTIQHTTQQTEEKFNPEDSQQLLLG